MLPHRAIRKNRVVSSFKTIGNGLKGTTTHTRKLLNKSMAIGTRIGASTMPTGYHEPKIVTDSGAIQSGIASEVPSITETLRGSTREKRMDNMGENVDNA